jgi:dihydroorotate dehydrogenase (NAD+) catalytic subunit
VKPDLSVRVGPIALGNPVIAASGTFGYGVEFEDIVDLDRLGGLVTKGISREPMAGNRAPRLVTTGGGMLNSIGLQNIGVKAFVEGKLPALARRRCAVFVNVFGHRVEDYVFVLEQLEAAEGVAAYELNVSCPNVHEGGMAFGSDARMLEHLVTRARQAVRRPLVVKLSPNVTSVALMARVCRDAGADAVSLVNTFLALAIDASTRRARLANGTGGLSGPAIKPIALRMVYEVARQGGIPVIGLGGITTPEDAVEFLIAGAAAVQVGTASFADPRATERIARGLENWCRGHHVERLATLTGSLESGPAHGSAPSGEGN